MLNDAVKGKSTLQAEILSADFILQSADGNQYSKVGFIDAYITNPKIKIASLSAEVYCDDQVLELCLGSKRTF